MIATVVPGSVWLCTIPCCLIKWTGSFDHSREYSITVDIDERLLVLAILHEKKKNFTHAITLSDRGIGLMNIDAFLDGFRSFK